MQILWHEKFRILLRELLRIGHHRCLEVQILHDLLREDCRIPPPILEHQIEGARRQRPPVAVVVEDVLLRDRDIALIPQLRQLPAQLLLANERARIADTVDTEVRKCNKALIHVTDIIICKRYIGFECKEEIHNDIDCRNQDDKLHADTYLFPSVLPSCKILMTDFYGGIRRGFPLVHPTPPISIFFACSFSCFFFSSSRSACVRRVPHVVFQNVTHATGICQSSTAS